MQSPGMNKLARPTCRQCQGDGAIRLPRTHEMIAEVSTPIGKSNAPGFKWVACQACGGEGRR
jgi:DnaJ-class molecular chaperone